MLRKFIFKYDADNEYILPISPKTFKVDYGIKVETVNIHTMGDVNIAGYGTLATVSIDCMLPAKLYPFMIGSYHNNPYSDVDKFKKWSQERTKLRFVISNTTINIPVVVENIAVSEKDGTNDIYATIRLREIKELNTIQTEDAPVEVQEPHVDYYTIKWGDTMWAISNRFYGDPTLCWGLALYNGIANANLIFPGQVLTIPPYGSF